MSSGTFYREGDFSPKPSAKCSLNSAYYYTL